MVHIQKTKRKTESLNFLCISPSSLSSHPQRAMPVTWFIFNLSDKSIYNFPTNASSPACISASSLVLLKHIPL